MADTTSKPVTPVNVLSLCSGIGGLDLGISVAVRGARAVCYVEREAYCCAVLAERMAEGRLAPAPVWTDVTTFDGRSWRGVVDIVAAGYPCQPFSHAGRRGGTTDPRHLWPHVARIIGECRPGAVFLENVSGHVSLGLREVRSQLEDMDYRIEAGLFRAEEVGLPHRRERLFVLAALTSPTLANTSRPRLEEWVGQWGDPRQELAPTERGHHETLANTFGGTAQLRRGPGTVAPAEGEAQREGDQRERCGNSPGCSGETLAYPDEEGHGLIGQSPRQRGVTPRDDADERGAGPSNAGPPPPPGDAGNWAEYLAAGGPEPTVRGGADGVSPRVDGTRRHRIAALGNAVAPAQAALAFATLARRFLDQ